MKDVLKAPAGKSADIRWTLVSEAKAELADNGILLSGNGKTALLSAKGASVEYKQFSNDPRSRKTITSDFERDFSKYSISGYTCSIPAGTEIILTTTITIQK